MEGLLGSILAARPSSASSNAGSTLVPPGAIRPRISETASTASTSAATDSSTQAAGSARSAGGIRRAPVATGASGTAGRTGLSSRTLRRPRDSAEGVAHLLQDARMGAGNLLAGLGGVFGQQLALPLAESRRHDDVHEDVKVALRAAAEMRDAPPAQPNLGPGLGSRLDLDVLAAVDRGNRDRRAQGRLGDRYV